jgi:hypothetical protein
MWGKTLLALCAALVVVCGFTASASVQAKDIGATVKIPEGGVVQLGFNGNFTIKVAGGTGLSGTCKCAGNEGTCEVSSIVVDSGQSLVCQKGRTGTCKSGCSMSGTPGAQ